MDAGGNLYLCAGLPAGIQGAVHSMTTAWENETVEPTEAADAPALTTLKLPSEAASVVDAPMEQEPGNRRMFTLRGCWTQPTDS